MIRSLSWQGVPVLASFKVSDHDAWLVIGNVALNGNTVTGCVAALNGAPVGKTPDNVTAAMLIGKSHLCQQNITGKNPVRELSTFS